MQTNNILITHPAHLWIGDPQTLANEVIQKLQIIFCKKSGCKTCIICQQIATQQFHQTVWINPEDSYSLEDIDAILEQVRFKLDRGQHKFFIFCKTEELSSACANRLLKTIEEPHEGYHFIFLATRTDTILPTVISRCLTQEFSNQNNTELYQEILDIFIFLKLQNPQSFIKLIDKLEIDTQNSKNIIDQLFAHFYYKLKQAHIAKENDLKLLHKNLNFLLILKKQYHQLPISGSTKIFWKNLFMEFHLIANLL